MTLDTRQPQGSTVRAVGAHLPLDLTEALAESSQWAGWLGMGKGMMTGMNNVAGVGNAGLGDNQRGAQTVSPGRV